LPKVFLFKTPPRPGVRQLIPRGAQTGQREISRRSQAERNSEIFLFFFFFSSLFLSTSLSLSFFTLRQQSGTRNAQGFLVVDAKLK